MDFTYTDYKKLSNDRMINFLLVADYATITEKLMIWQNKGRDNPTWQKDSGGPIISPGADREPIILDEIPYCVALSNATSKLLTELVDMNQFSYSDAPGTWKGNRIKLSFDEKSSLELLSPLIIPMQFSFLEYFEFHCFENELRNGSIIKVDTEKYSLKDFKEKGFERILEGRIKHYMTVYQRHSIKDRMKYWEKILIQPLEEDVIIIYEDLSNLRNITMSPLPLQYVRC